MNDVLEDTPEEVFAQLTQAVERLILKENVRVVSTPHNFSETLLCTRITFDVLKPENDTVILGGMYSSFTGMSVRTSSDVSKLKNTSRKAAEQQLASLLTRSFGVFKTEQLMADGSTVYYLHDRPYLSESVNIWKLTGSAFAVSSDGGKTWSAGVNADGSVVLNILSAIGIDANWIKAETMKIGSWEINDGAIYKEYTNPANGFIYRVWIQTPDHWNDSDGIRPFIQVDVSEDGGATFNTYVTFNDQNLTFTLYDGSSIIRQGHFSHTELNVHNRQSGSSLFVNASAGWMQLSNMDITVDGKYGLTGDAYAQWGTNRVKFTFNCGILVGVQYDV